MQHHSAILTTILSAIFGALCGFVAWIAIYFVAVGEFMRYPMAQEEVSLAAGIGPSFTALFVLMGVGLLAGGFFGWRLAVRRRVASRVVPNT